MATPANRLSLSAFSLSVFSFSPWFLFSRSMMVALRSSYFFCKSLISPRAAASSSSTLPAALSAAAVSVDSF